MDLFDLNTEFGSPVDPSPVSNGRESLELAAIPVRKSRKQKKMESQMEKSARSKSGPHYNYLPVDPRHTNDIKKKIHKYFNTVPAPYKPFLHIQYQDVIKKHPLLSKDRIMIDKMRILEKERVKRESKELKENKQVPMMRWYSSISRPSDGQPTMRIRTQPMPMNFNTNEGLSYDEIFGADRK